MNFETPLSCCCCRSLASFSILRCYSSAFFGVVVHPHFLLFGVQRNFRLLFPVVDAGLWLLLLFFDVVLLPLFAVVFQSRFFLFGVLLPLFLSLHCLKWISRRLFPVVDVGLWLFYCFPTFFFSLFRCCSSAPFHFFGVVLFCLFVSPDCPKWISGHLYHVVAEDLWLLFLFFEVILQPFLVLFSSFISFSGVVLFSLFLSLDYLKWSLRRLCSVVDSGFWFIFLISDVILQPFLVLFFSLISSFMTLFFLPFSFLKIILNGLILRRFYPVLDADLGLFFLFAYVDLQPFLALSSVSFSFFFILRCLCRIVDGGI